MLPDSFPDTSSSRTTVLNDLTAGVVVFFVALPLCLGVALASNAPLLSGVLAGVIGGVLVGALSGTKLAVSGPAAGLTAVVAAQVAALGSFHVFLMALVVAGLIQIALGMARAGSVSAFFPSSVIKGLLTGIGVLLILKQIPLVLGHAPDATYDTSFLQSQHPNPFFEIWEAFREMHLGSAVIGFVSIGMLILWSRWKSLRKSYAPAPLAVVLLGTCLSLIFQRLGGRWVVGTSHRVQVPVVENLVGYFRALPHPDFSQWSNPAIYSAALAIAAVASLETLLNLEAIDKLDPKRRTSPRSRELMAQGAGNLVSGLLGGLPVTLAIARSSVNIQSGAQTKLATIIQGCLLLSSAVLLSPWLNLIPLSCLAAILLVTGFKLARPSTVKQMWDAGHSQFVPFTTTVIAIVLTDPLVGILLGLAVSVAYILRSSMRRPIRRIVEKHLGGDVVRIELANQVSFLNRAALGRALDGLPKGGHVLLDAQNTDYIDADVLEIIRDFKTQTGPARNVEVSLVGFRDKYQLQDQTQYVDYSTRELQKSLTPQQVLRILLDGHDRFITGRRLTRDLGRQILATSTGQHPLAVVLHCIDSRSPAELIFDVGVGEIFSVRIAGNVISRKVLGSVEYGCAVAGAKLIVVMGHTRCGAVGAAVDLMNADKTVAEATGCQHVEYLVHEIQKSIVPQEAQRISQLDPKDKERFVNDVACRNVMRTVALMTEKSLTLTQLVNEDRIAIVGAMYDVVTGGIEVLADPAGRI